ncbi:hypothetical protein I4R02_004656 [Salmonella enterica]|nr:hypothetical protein [Salmonella enterica]
MGVLCRQFVECVAELRDKNGKIIRCPFARILHDRGGCRSAERQKNASVPAKKIGTRNPCVLLRCRIGQTPQSDVSDAIPQRLPGDLQSVQQTKKTAVESGQDTCLYSRHTVGTPNILVRAAPRHPANASRHAKKFRVPLTVPELVKQKIAGSRAFGVGSDFVIDDVTGKTLGMVVGVTQ